MPADDGRPDREPQLLPRPGDGVEHVREDRDDDQADHDREEHVVAAGLALGDRDRDVAERGRHDHRPTITSSRPSALRTSDQDAERRRSRRPRPTSRRARSPRKAADQRHPDRERDPVAPAVARVEPQRGEDRVRADDPEPDVRIVHPDPALGEQHAVDEDDDPEDDRDRPALEQEPREDVQERAPSARPAMTPGTRQAYACRPISTEATSPPASNASSCWRSVDGYCWLSSMTIAVGTARQRRVGVDRVAVRLDDVDRVGAGRVGPIAAAARSPRRGPSARPGRRTRGRPWRPGG